MTANSNRMQNSSCSVFVCVCVCIWGEGVAACMFFLSLFHLLFIFAVARSRRHVPPGACQVSGNQSDWLISACTPAQQDPEMLSHTHTQLFTHRLSELFALIVSSFLSFFLPFFLFFRSSSVCLAPAVSPSQPDADGVLECVASCGLTPLANTLSKHPD